MQEVFISLYKNLDKYSSLDEHEMRNLLCKMALNKCKDYYRSGYAKHIVTDDTILNFEQVEGVEEDIFLKERKLYVQKMVNELKEPYRTVIYERYINEKSLDEVAAITGSNKEIVKTQIYRGKKALKEKMKGGENFYG